MKNLIYILNILMILIFASCKDENSFMSVDDNQPCYSILVSARNNATRATYEESGEDIAIKWEKGDVIYLGEDEFVFKEMRGDNGLFFHYGDITNANNWTGKVSFGSDPDTKDQVQKKNNTCCEHLVANVVESIDLRDVPTISLLPDKNMSLLHIQTKSPATFLKGSLLKIKGLWQDYSVTLGNTNDPVFVYKDDVLDVYVAVPGNKTIRETAAVKLYFYAYDENAEAGKDPQTNGDEYHYYMKCNAAITTKNNEVVKLPLPNKPTHVAIQLGLPSGTKWATMNVGATKESEGGDAYAWGATNTNSFISVNKTYFELSGTVLDEYKRLKPEYDAATESWGENWVMPTYAETWELVYQGTTWTSATKDGVSGYIVSKGNKSIFLPSSTNYWLSDLVNNNYNSIDQVAYSLYFDNGGKISNGGGRSTKRFIRPILASSRTTQAYKSAIEDKEEGMLSGVFSVGSNKKVKFSKGNLQYQASTNTWRFAENQYDVVGTDNKNISSDYSGWIDLFGWGTSGWNSGAKAYQPYSTSTNNSDYNVGNDQNKDLTGTYKNADWGVYNAISNGGNEAGLWRVLTKGEASFLIARENNNGELLLTKATVNGWPGVLFFPDNFLTSCVEKVQGIQLGYTDNFKTNIITKDFFEYLEFLGVVFLPVTGYREGNNVTELGEEDTYKPNPSIDDVKLTGTYWLSTHSGAKASCVVYKNKIKEADRIVHVSDCERKGANSVRLVHDVK